jgi:antitoxin MazE
MEAVVKKWGNSLGVRLPAPILKEAHLEENAAVLIRAVRGRIVITRRAARVRRYRLANLLSGVENGNLHGSVDFGASVGNEAL